MPTARGGYRLASGEQVPSVTTILSRFKSSRALMVWANREGLAGRTIDESRDKAADVGTAAHAMVEAYIKQGATERPDVFDRLSPEQIEKALRAFDAFQEWANHSKLTVVRTEVQLVSERHRFGGTPDAIGLIRDRYALLDWKTSNRAYFDMWLQLAGYLELCDENLPEYAPLSGAHLVRFGKEHGDFTHSYRPRAEFALAWRQFCLFREAYENEKELKMWAA